ncbi:MAG: hypothetical protein IIB18_02350 [Chloroflexi bacterium]|nr:hypothetical protein [Chloroflexota bacterium]
MAKVIPPTTSATATAPTAKGIVLFTIAMLFSYAAATIVTRFNPLGDWHG